MQPALRRRQNRTFVQAKVDDEASLVFVASPNSQSIVLKMWSGGACFHQNLLWAEACAADKGRLYSSLAELYRSLRRNGLTEHSLRFLARGDNPERNGGYAVGTRMHRLYCQSVVEAARLLERIQRKAH